MIVLITFKLCAIRKIVMHLYVSDVLNHVLRDQMHKLSI